MACSTFSLPGPIHTASTSAWHQGGAGIGVGFLSPEYAGQYEIRRWHWGTGDRPPIPYAAGRPATRWGFGHDSVRDPVFRWVEIVFPFWLPTALFAALPLARGALSVHRRLRVREGHCTHCGYDLRATPGRCPECGKIPAT